MFRLWLAAIRAATTPLLILGAAVLVGVGSAMIAVSLHEADVRDRIERAEQTGRQHAERQYEGTLERVRAELADVRDARDRCYAAADGAAPVIYDYYADEPDAQQRYAAWLPLVERCRNIAAPAPESDGDGTGFARTATTVGGGR